MQSEEIEKLILELRELVKQRNELKEELAKIQEKLRYSEMSTAFLLRADIKKAVEVVKEWNELRKEANRLREVIDKLDGKISEINLILWGNKQ